MDKGKFCKDCKSRNKEKFCIELNKFVPRKGTCEKFNSKSK